jgi:hypothetical protein
MIDITGRWAGAYSQHGREHAITAIFAQFDEHLQGKMTDAETEFEQSVFDAAFEAGLPPGADEQIVAELRKQYPDAPRGPIRAASRVPEFSVLEGSVEGRTVRFTKRYLGDHFSGWKIGDRLVGKTDEATLVSYSGTLSVDGNLLEGRWWVAGDQPKTRGRNEGSFLLLRQED